MIDNKSSNPDSNENKTGKSLLSSHNSQKSKTVSFLRISLESVRIDANWPIAIPELKEAFLKFLIEPKKRLWENPREIFDLTCKR